jgi:hypothetical protein
MDSYEYLVALRVPDASRGAANSLAAEITGMPSDLSTFSCEVTDGDDTHWVTQIPMRAQYFAALPGLRDDLGGDFAAMAHRVDGRWVQLDSVWDWVHRSGFRAVVLPDDDI